MDDLLPEQIMNEIVGDSGNGGNSDNSSSNSNSDNNDNNSERESEVFNLSENKYTYDDAKLACKSFGAELATITQLNKAHKKGANWCNYGWSAHKCIQSKRNMGQNPGWPQKASFLWIPWIKRWLF